MNCRMADLSLVVWQSSACGARSSPLTPVYGSRRYLRARLQRFQRVFCVIEPVPRSYAPPVTTGTASRARRTLAAALTRVPIRCNNPGVRTTYR